MTFRCYKGGREYGLTSYASKSEASIDGGTVFAYYDGGIKYLATIDPKYVEYSPIMFRFKDSNGNERAVLQKKSPSVRWVIHLTNFTSKTIYIPSDKCLFGVELQFRSAKGFNGSSGSYSTTGGSGGNGGSGGKGVQVYFNSTNYYVYGGGGGGGGGGGITNKYGDVVKSAGSGGSGGNGSVVIKIMEGNYSGKMVNITVASQYNGGDGYSGSNASSTKAGSGGSGGKSHLGSGGSASGANGGNGANSDTPYHTATYNEIYIGEIYY